MTIGHPVFLPHPISREIGGVRCKTDYMKVLIATTSSWFSPLPIQIFSVIFQDYQHIVQTAFSKAEMQKILSLSDHEVSALHTSNSESLDGLACKSYCRKFRSERPRSQHQRRYRQYGPLSLHPRHINYPATSPH